MIEEEEKTAAVQAKDPGDKPVAEWGSLSIDKLAVDLAAAQAEFPTINKTHTGEIRTRAGGAFKYKYAGLDDILAALRPCLSKHGLAIQQRVWTSLNGQYYANVQTVLLHKSGQWVQSPRMACPVAELPTGNALQSLGSTFTYLKRYQLCAFLGIEGEEDKDAADVPGKPGTAKPGKSDRPAPGVKPPQPGNNSLPQDKARIAMLASIQQILANPVFAADRVQLLAQAEGIKFNQDLAIFKGKLAKRAEGQTTPPAIPDGVN